MDVSWDRFHIFTVPSPLVEANTSPLLNGLVSNINRTHKLLVLTLDEIEWMKANLHDLHQSLGAHHWALPTFSKYDHHYQ